MFDGFYLTLLIGPTVPVPAPRELLDALTSVEVTSAAGEPGGFQLAFRMSNQSPLQTLFLLAAGQTPLLRVIVVATINGLPQVLMDGVTTRNDLSSGSKPGESTLTVTGVDLTRVMDLFDFTGLLYPALPVEARVAACVGKYAVYGMLPLIIPSLFTEVPNPVNRIPTHQGTDLAYIQQLADEAGYVFYIDPGPVPGTNTAYWGPEIKTGVPQPALNVGMDAETNCEGISFSFETTNATLPIVMVQNSLTRAPIPIPIPSINPLQPPLGAIPPLPTRVSILHDTANLSLLEALSRGVSFASRSMDAVNGTGSLDVLRYGRLLKARQLVGVRGVGMAYDGLYFVKSVTTTIERGSVKQRFTLTRNGIVSLTPLVPA